MSLLPNINVFHLPLRAYSPRVLPNDSEASNAALPPHEQAHLAKTPRFAPNAALAHLKTREPHLTSAQRESIARLQERELHGGGSSAVVTTEEAAKLRRSKFTVV